MGALLYLTLCSMKNRLRVRVRRLKEPRYFIGSIAGIAYFYFLLWRPRGSSRGPGQGAPGVLAMIARGRQMVELFGAGALFVVAALAWVWPSKSRPALAFTRADVQFLFPAPFTRRQLIRYKIVRSQLGALIGSALMTLFFRPSTLAGGWMFFVGISVVMAIVNLHLTGVSLSRESLGTHGMAGMTRQWLPIVLVGGALVLLAGAVVMDWPQLSSLASGGAVLDEIQRLTAAGPVAIVLWPFRAIVRLPLAATPVDFLHALPGALLILALNYVWVLRSDAAFEEASAELAEKVARIRKGPQPAAPKATSKLSTPFTLSLEGRPEMAIFWKNLILVGRYVSLKTLVRFIPIFIALGIVFTRKGEGGMGAVFGAVCAGVFIMTVIMGPQIARNDLRQDLANLAVLKTWPVRGASLVRGEVMAPAAILIVIAWFCAIGGLMFGTRMDMLPSIPIAAILIAPGVILMQLLVQNAIAVMWPSWVVIGSNRARGIDVMGQRMIMMFGLLLVLVVSVLPAGLAGGIVMFAVYWTTGSLPIVLPAVIAAVVLLVEALLTSEAVGKALDRTDVSSMDAMET
jgi:hypothetical protein